MSWRNACPAFKGTPLRAISTAGPTSSAHGSRPKRLWAAARPAGAPGTATAAGPMRKTCFVRSSKGTSTATIADPSPGGRSAPGTAAKKSRSLSLASRAEWTSMKPPPPGPVSGLSATQETNADAMQASTAFPPSARILAPAWAVSGWPAATAPFMGRA